MSERNIFYYNNDKNNEIKAGGLLIYKKENNNIFLLLIENRGLYEDIGGRCDLSDKNIIETITREVEEETNNIIKKENLVLENYKEFYNKKCKYLMLILHADEYIKNLKSEQFGDIEIHDNIQRKIKWIDINEFFDKNIIKYKLNFRLKNKILFDILENIKISNNN